MSQYHPYYISTTTIIWVPNKQQIQITSRLFTEDVETAIQQAVNPQLKLDPDSEIELIDQFVEHYVKKNVVIQLDGAPLVLTYLGREYKNELIVVYLEATPAIDFTQLSVQNRLLFETFETQQNIVHISSPFNKKSYLLHSKKTGAIFEIE